MLLYIHIPFCDSKCGYCGFNSLVNKLELKSDYLKALKFDLESCLVDFSPFESVYIGGGTPNTLSSDDYNELFEILHAHITDDCEITIELNPNATQSLQEFKSLGINRFSIGIQSFNDEKLRLLERNHDTKIAKHFIENALKCDVNVSIDLIYDTLLDSPQSLKKELEEANSLCVGHISCYALSIDKYSRFYATNNHPILESSLCYEVKELLESYHFTQYEVSNFAKTHKSKHNLGYWQYKEYLGIGLGAVSRIQNKRLYRQNNLASYIKNPLISKVEYLTPNDIKLEKLLLGLRSEVGVEIDEILSKDKLPYLLKSNQCKQIGDRIYAQNYFLADEIALWLS